MTTQPQSLRRVQVAAAKASAAREAFEQEIRVARAAGATLREIAAVAGLAVESVRTISRRADGSEA